MIFNMPSGRSAEALARAHQHWQQRHGADHEAVPPPFSIALSREAGTYGAAVARQVGDRLGWPVYDKELLQHIADTMGVRQSLVESVDERRGSWLEQALSGFFAVPAVSESKYMRHLVEMLLSLATHGHCVVVGRAATDILPRATTLRVRVVAPLDFRIAAVQGEHGISRKEAAERVVATDRGRNSFVTEHFQVDPTNPANYDLILNVARFSIGECADIICAALDRLQKHGANSPSIPSASFSLVAG